MICNLVVGSKNKLKRIKKFFTDHANSERRVMYFIFWVTNEKRV